MAKVDVIASVDEAYLDRFSEVVQALKEKGLNVDQEGELRDIGVINGSIDAEEVDKLRDVEGVAHVEISRTLRITPPDHDIQ